MIRWVLEGANVALETIIGERTAEGLRLSGRLGWALYGPHLDLPAGSCTARVVFSADSLGRGYAEITADGGNDVLATTYFQLEASPGQSVALETKLDKPRSNCEIRIRSEEHLSGLIERVEIDLVQPEKPIPLPDRAVGHESSKTYAEKINSGFWSKYLGDAAVLEVGYKGYWGNNVPIVPQAVGVDIGYPGYDGTKLPFADESFGGIYSSHCFEHISDYVTVLRDWYRVLKTGGYLIIIVPHHHLFEKRQSHPSHGNPDHKRFYTPASLLLEIAEAFPVNSYRVRHLRENDLGFNYQDPPWAHSNGQYEIEIVVEKIAKPYWNLDDDSVRPYNAAEFRTKADRSDPWSIRIDGRSETGCLVWGPYVRIGPGNYIALFDFEIEPSEQPIGIICDVALNTARIASGELVGSSSSGRVTVELTFRCASFDDEIEFRIYKEASSDLASVVFKGVSLRYREQPMVHSHRN